MLYLQREKLQFRWQETALTGGLLLGLFKSLQLIMGTYDGWMSVSFFAEEDSNPSKNIPKSYMFGASAIAVLVCADQRRDFICASRFNDSQVRLWLLPMLLQLLPSAAWSGTLMTAVAIFLIRISILNAYMMIPSRILCSD